MSGKHYSIIGTPVETGAGRRGCQMGPDALRTAGLQEALEALGLKCSDRGDVRPPSLENIEHDFSAKNLTETVAWTKAISQAGLEAFNANIFPIFAGGDHSLSLGSITAACQHAHEQGRPLYLLWIDAHPDFHRLETTTSGNLHGTPVAYVTGQPGFTPYFPEVQYPLPLENICMIGIRSVDAAERQLLIENGVRVHDMRHIDEHGIVRPLQAFLQQVVENNGMLHVSFDVDFLDPSIGPAVGTTVPGGANFREAHMVMEMIHESGLATSLDLVELNPFLDHGGKTASLLVDLTASLLGKKIMDRPTTI